MKPLKTSETKKPPAFCRKRNTNKKCIYTIYLCAGTMNIRDVQFGTIFVFPISFFFGHSPTISTFRKQFPNHAYQTTQVLLCCLGLYFMATQLSISCKIWVLYISLRTSLKHAYNMWAKFSVVWSSWLLLPIRTTQICDLWMYVKELKQQLL